MTKKRRGACIMLAFITVLSSCKKNEKLDNLTDTNLKANTLASGGDGKWDLLGYGLDVTGDLYDANSISDASIIDVEKFAKDYVSRVDVNRTGSGKDNYYGGVSAFDYLKEVNKSKSFDANGNAKIKGSSDKDLNFTGSIKKNSSDSTIKTYSSKYSYATFEVYRIVKRLYFTQDATTELLINYLTPEFKNNIANQSADELVKRYGTHVMLDIGIGGSLMVNYSGFNAINSDYEKNTKNVKVALGFSVLNMMGVNISKEYSTEEITKITNETREKEYSTKFYGGTNSGKSISIDKDGYTSEAVNIASWEQSINDTNAALISVEKTVFLYDLITDPSKKALVKSAVEKYIKASQLTLAPTIIHEFYNTKNGKHAYALDANMHLRWPASGWKPNAQPFKGFPYSYNNAVPVYQFINEKYDDRILTTNRNFNLSGYKYDGITFYGYSSQISGTVPIHQFSFTNGSYDHFYHPNANAAAPHPGWKRDGIAFWAFPN